MSELSFLLVRIAFFLIPLESLGVTVSKGWNALAYLPILLAFVFEALSTKSLSDLFNKLLSTNIARRLSCFLVLALFFSIFAYILHGIPSLAGLLELPLKIAAPISLVCLLVLFEMRYSTKFWEKLINSLLYGYILSILIHLTSGFGIFFLLQNARTGSSGVTAFTFTEPSFVSVHLYYVLLVFICYPQALVAKVQKYKLVILSLLILFITLVSQIALRPVVDFFVIAIIASLFYIAPLARKFFIKNSISTSFFYGILIVVLLIFLFPVVAGRFSRFGILVSSLINGNISALAAFDVSSYIRIFSMDVLLPRFSALYEMFFGFGVGNLCSASFGLKPLVFNYQGMPDLKFVDEINSMLSANCIRESFSMILALLAETGILLSVYFFASFYSKRYVFIYILLLASCVQFNSFSLYIFPLYSYLLIRDQMNLSSRNACMTSIRNL